MKSLLLNLIRFYQKYLSPDTGLFKRLYLVDSTCRFRPTCSEYMYQVIVRYGIIVGLRKGFLRILRCNPFNPGGWDPVP